MKTATGFFVYTDNRWLKKSSRIVSSMRLQGSARVTQLQTVVGACGYIAYTKMQPAQEITDWINPKFHEIPQPT